MGDLRDQLNKAGFLGRKDMKRLAHEDRVRRKEEGHDAADRDREQSRREYERQLEEKRRQDRELEERRNEERRRREQRDRLQALVASRQVKDRDRACRWFFVTRTGWIPWLEIGLDTARRLESGNLAVVDLPWERVESFAVVPREVALELRAWDPECVRVLAGG